MQSCTFTYHRYRNNSERILLTYPPRHKPVRLQCRNKYDGVEKLAGARRSEKGERRQLVRTVTVLKCSKFLNAFIYFLLLYLETASVFCKYIQRLHLNSDSIYLAFTTHKVIKHTGV